MQGQDHDHAYIVRKITGAMNVNRTLKSKVEKGDYMVVVSFVSEITC